MKKCHFILRRAALFLLAIASSIGIYSVHSQGTAFSYQGRLNNAGSPSSGFYDLLFTLYDAGSASNSLTGPVINTTIVSNGLFSLNLDFGASSFNGSPRWLDIAVRTNGSGGFSTLTPRQPLLATPYSIFAGTAANITSGSVVKSLNNLKDNITLVAGPNVTLSTNGNTLTIAGNGIGGSWSLNGASIYYNSGNVGLGTSTPQGLVDVNCGGSDL